MKRLVIVAFTILGLSATLIPATAAAAATTLGQTILPLNCIFEEVHDGTGTLYYLTPKECGIIAPPTQGGNAGNDRSGQSHGAGNAQRPAVASSGIPAFLTFGQVEGANFPWQPLVSVAHDGGVDIANPGARHASQEQSLFSGIGPFLAHLAVAAISYRPATKQVVVGVAGGAFFIALLFIMAA